jgi:hypothetical protein
VNIVYRDRVVRWLGSGGWESGIWCTMAVSALCQSYTVWSHDMCNVFRIIVDSHGSDGVVPIGVREDGRELS